MLIRDDVAITRLSSPLNLLNRISKRKENLSLFTGSKNNNLNNDSNSKSNTAISAVNVPDNSPVKLSIPVNSPSVTVSDNPAEPNKTLTADEILPSEDKELKLDNLIENADNQIKLSNAHNTALDVLTRAVSMAGMKLDDVKPEKLPAIIAATSKVVESIRRERSEAAKQSNGRAVHLHFYTPQQKSLRDYEVLEVS